MLTSYAYAPVLPHPCDLGLPAKFDAWRPGQDRSVVKAADHEMRFVVPALPTGFGKSAFALAVARSGAVPSSSRRRKRCRISTPRSSRRWG
jgi:hypothetical protein